MNIYDGAAVLVSTMTYDDAAPWPVEAEGTPGILTDTIPVTGATWSDLKSLFR